MNHLDNNAGLNFSDMASVRYSQLHRMLIDKGSKSISPWFEGNFINCRVVEYYSKGVTKRYFRFPDESCLTITKYRTGRSIQFDVEISNIKNTIWT